MEMANETRTSPRTAEVDPLPGRVAPSVQEMQRSLMMPQPHEHPRGDSPRTLELQRLRMQGRVSSGVSAGSQASRRPERASAFAKFASWSSNPQPAQAAETADEQKPSPRTLELQRLRGQGRVSATSAARSMQATPPQRETMDLAVETPSPRTLELQRLRGQGRVSAGSQVARSLQSPPPASAEGMTLGSPEQKPSPRTLELQQLRMQGRVSAGSHAMQRTPTEEFGASRSSGPAGMGRTRVQDLPGFSTSPGTAPSSSVQPRRSSPIRLEESSIYAEPDIDAQPSHGLAARSAEKPVPKRLGSWSSRDSCDSDLGLRTSLPSDGTVPPIPPDYPEPPRTSGQRAVGVPMQLGSPPAREVKPRLSGSLDGPRTGTPSSASQHSPGSNPPRLSGALPRDVDLRKMPSTPPRTPPLAHAPARHERLSGSLPSRDSEGSSAPRNLPPSFPQRIETPPAADAKKMDIGEAHAPSRNMPPSSPQRIETPPAADAKKMDIGEAHAPSRLSGALPSRDTESPSVPRNMPPSSPQRIETPPAADAKKMDIGEAHAPSRLSGSCRSRDSESPSVPRNMPPSSPQRIETPPAADAKKMDIGEAHAPSRLSGSCRSRDSESPSAPRNLPPSCPQRIETPPAADAKKMDIGEVHAPSRAETSSTPWPTTALPKATTGIFGRQERVAPGATNESDESSGSPPLALGTWLRSLRSRCLLRLRRAAQGCLPAHR
ncbi:unnamed protein product [Durusdinium trenchii]|uniref:Uncharacterized protein n=1 Tax=Durusdinium trenchii TaxID=1381693 RepID=A0ABP0IKK2_9DINO